MAHNSQYIPTQRFHCRDGGWAKEWHPHLQNHFSRTLFLQRAVWGRVRNAEVLLFLEARPPTGARVEGTLW